MRPLVQLLYFWDCPHHERARALIEEVSAELGVEPDLQLVQIAR